MQLPLISIVVPAYNGEATIKECLLSILNNNYDNSSIELIVLDDGSKDNTESIVRELLNIPKQIKFISQTHKGVAAARDLGIKNAKGKFIFIISQDTFADKNWFSEAVRIFMSDQTVGIVQGKTDLTEKIRTPFCHATQVLSPSFNFPTVAIAYRAEALDNAGRYFDIRLSGYGDDTDVAWRILSKGYTFRWLDKVTAYHGVYPIKNGLIYNLRRSFPGPQALALLVKKNPDMKKCFKIPFIWGHPIRLFYAYGTILGISLLIVNSVLGTSIITFIVITGFLKSIYRNIISRKRNTKLNLLQSCFVAPLNNYLCYLALSLGILKGAIKHRCFLL